MFKSQSGSTVIKIRLLIILVAGFSGVLFAQQDDDSGSKPAKLFESEKTLEIKLTAPWPDLIRNERYQGTYPATLEYVNENGQAVKLDLTVERRGVKRQEACEFPPIKLRFEKEEVKGTMFRGQKSVKMVTHCKRTRGYEQYYILEMLAYRMYNLITDFSFRTRPLTVDYHNSENDSVEDDRFAFLIEDDSDVAKRNGLKKLDIDRVRPSWLEKTVTSEMTLFQYLIGNVDWSALSGPDPEECCHNIKPIAKRPFEDGDLVYPIPYDFDSSGLVDAPYAAPPAGVRIRKVTQRLFRGICLQNETLPAAREKFLANEAAIMAVLDSEPRLDDRESKQASRYLDDFFNVLKSDKYWQKKIIESCRK
jgi:hypothetical protein